MSMYRRCAYCNEAIYFSKPRQKWIHYSATGTWTHCLINNVEDDSIVATPKEGVA